jgi:tetratricopeptide (TPR) repeat protein
VSHQPTGTEALVAAFSFNKNLHQAKLNWRFNEQFTDSRWATAYVGAELLAQQERAAKRYDQQTTALRSSVDEQTRQNAQNARVLQTTIQESSDAVRRAMSNTTDAVKQTTAAINELSSHVAQLAWLQAEQNATLRTILETIREGRANECRQLVEQGERNFHAGFLGDAEERFRLALGFDNTDYVTHQNLGLTLVGLGRLDEALEHFRKALAFPPKNSAQASGFFVARAATHASRVLYAKEDYAGAEMYLRKALDADDRNAKNWYDLAVVRTYLGNERGAIEALQHAFRGDAMLAGAALADAELAPIHASIEDLVMRQTAQAMTETLNGPAATLKRTEARVAEILRSVGVAPSPVVDVDEILRRFRDTGTLAAARAASAALRDAQRQLVRRASNLVRVARVNFEKDVQIRVAAADRRRANKKNAEIDRIEELKTIVHKRSLGSVLSGAYSAAKAEIDEMIRRPGQSEYDRTAEERGIRAEAAARLAIIDGYLEELEGIA